MPLEFKFEVYARSIPQLKQDVNDTAYDLGEELVFNAEINIVSVTIERTDYCDFVARVVAIVQPEEVCAEPGRFMH